MELAEEGWTKGEVVEPLEMRNVTGTRRIAREKSQTQRDVKT
jgi:hypothetical protein